MSTVQSHHNKAAMAHRLSWLVLQLPPDKFLRALAVAPAKAGRDGVGHSAGEQDRGELRHNYIHNAKQSV